MKPAAPVQIVPAGPGGVADFAACLAAEWQAMGVASRCVPLAAADAAWLGRFEAEAPLVLHFSGYGYAVRGLCDWLADGIEQLRARAGARLRLVTVFHELYAVGPPWRSAFWTSAAQRRIAARLARASDALWTNTASHARWLAAQAPARPLGVQPVFSNLGEPAAPPPFAARARSAVVFGSPATRARAFAALARQPGALQALGVQQLVEAGPGAPCRGAPGLPPRRHAGLLPAAELRHELQQAAFGVLDYPGPLLGKSGVFAALAACGCVAVNTDRDCAPGDGLLAGRDYLALGAPADDAPQIAARVHAWYAGHGLGRQARQLLAWCSDAAPQPLEQAA